MVELALKILFGAILGYSIPYIGYYAVGGLFLAAIRVAARLE